MPDKIGCFVRHAVAREPQRYWQVEIGDRVGGGVVLRAPGAYAGEDLHPLDRIGRETATGVDPIAQADFAPAAHRRERRPAVVGAAVSGRRGRANGAGDARPAGNESQRSTRCPTVAAPDGRAAVLWSSESRKEWRGPAAVTTFEIPESDVGKRGPALSVATSLGKVLVAALQELLDAELAAAHGARRCARGAEASAARGSCRAPRRVEIGTMTAFGWDAGVAGRSSRPADRHQDVSSRPDRDPRPGE